MFPWPIKRIFAIIHTLKDIVFLSIAHSLFQVEIYLQMDGGFDLFCQFLLGSSEFLDRLDVPRLFLECKIGF